jgi:hypothetical protein
VIYVTACNGLMLFLTKDGDVWSGGVTGGAGGRGGLVPTAVFGHGGGTYTRSRPKKIDKLKHIRTISAGVGFAYAVDQNGWVFSWGWGARGVLGHGDMRNRGVPTRVGALEGVNVTDVATGTSHVLFLTVDGRVLSCGDNLYGQLGSRPCRRPQPVPTCVDALDDDDVNKIAAGAGHSLVITRNGVVLSFGDNSDGQCGHEGGLPGRINDLPPARDVCAAACNSLIVSSVNTIYVLGALRPGNNAGYGQGVPYCAEYGSSMTGFALGAPKGEFMITSRPVMVKFTDLPIPLRIVSVVSVVATDDANIVMTVVTARGGRKLIVCGSETGGTLKCVRLPSV